MGLSLSLLFSAWNEILERYLFFNMRSISLERGVADLPMNKPTVESPIRHQTPRPDKLVLDTSTLLNSFFLDKDNDWGYESTPRISVEETILMFTPRPVNELDDAATKLQKVYKSYRTRRNLADCAVVVEELWWKALEFASLKRSSVSFFDVSKHETAASRWARARTRAAKVGKGLSKDEKAQKLALQHWLEAIDPRHRYGHNLHFYYDIWSDSKSTQPFFYWLDVGEGREVNVERCPRKDLQRQCISYLGPKEREAYEVIVEDGKLVYKQSGVLLDTDELSKWIFVLSTARALYVGQKKKGVFQHSSFLSGGATTAAGRLVAHNGILEAIWPYSGHYLPTEDNFQEFISFLKEHQVDLTNVKRCSIDDDGSSYSLTSEDSSASLDATPSELEASSDSSSNGPSTVTIPSTTLTEAATKAANARPPAFDLAKPLACNWSSGVGPRIGCVRDYPTDLQSLALEKVNLSPRVTPGRSRSSIPIPSPRPTPRIRLSPRLSHMGLPSPRPRPSLVQPETK